MPNSRPRWAQVAPAETPGLRGLTTLAVSVVVVAGLYLGREVLIPITLAILLSFVLAPLVELFRRMHLGRVPSVVLAVFIAVSMILAIGGVIGIQIAGLADDVPKYEATIREKINAAQRSTIEPLGRLIGSVGREVDRAGRNERAAQSEQPAPATVPSLERAPLPVEVRQPPPSPLALAERVITPTLNPLATAAIILIVAVFVLLQQEDLRDRLIRLFGSSDLHRTTVAMDDAARRLSRYFLTQLAINAAFGVIIGAGLFFIGIPSPILWGVLAALLRFVPYVGAPLAGILPVALGAAVDPGWFMFIATAALFLVAEPIMGQVVEPMLYGHSTGLSPVSVVVSTIFWAWLWGPIGLILATPLTLCLVVLGRHIERLEFLDVILGDRPALTPIENFYQRILSGDPVEALEQAELLLKERSLSSYYDEVALKGLQLASADVLRGVITEAQMERMQDAVYELVDGLEGHPDADPDSAESADDVVAAPGAEQRLPRQPAPDVRLPPEDVRAPAWRSPTAIMCVGGRRALDEGVAAVLVQLLQKHGLGAYAVAREELSRTKIASFDGKGAMIVCITYLDIEGIPFQLRYIVRRVRSRLPNAVIVAGFWGADDPVIDDEHQRKSGGADHYVRSLREAVITCLEIAKDAPNPTAVASSSMDEQQLGRAL
jgi:predicted PurR-regulated permease PerM